MPKIKDFIAKKLRKAETELYAVWLAVRNKNTPWYARLLGIIACVYAFSPIDLIPDFIPILGYPDDLLLVPLLAAAAVRCIPRSVLEDCRARAGELLIHPPKGKWYYAIPAVLVWCLLLFWLIRLLL